jgi:hypothetical protein
LKSDFTSSIQDTEHISDKLGEISPNATRVIKRPFGNRKIEIVPGLLNMSGNNEVSNTYKQFLTDLHSAFFHLVKDISLDKDWAERDGVTSDGSSLLTAAGFPMLPMGHPNVFASNHHPNKPSARHLKIANELIQSFFNHWQPKYGFKINAKSSTGFPFFSFDRDFKKGFTLRNLKNFKEIATALQTSDIPTLLNYHCFPATYISRRFQADSHQEVGVAKDRYAFTKLDLLTGNEEGTLTDRDLSEGGLLQRERARLVYAAPAGLNLPIGAIFTGWRDVFYDIHSFAYKQKGEQDLLDKIQGKYPLGVDVKQFDNNYPIWFAQLIWDQLAVASTDEFAQVAKLLWTLPIYSPAISPSETPDRVWLGDPFVSNEGPNVGLPSGIAYNPDAGKLYGTFVLLCLFDDIFKDVLEVGVSKILQGLHLKYSLLDASDDALMLFSDNNYRSQVRQKIESGDASPYLKLEPEKPVSYLGYVPISDSSGNIIDITRSAENYLANRYVPERSIGSNHREFWGIGYTAKQDLYKSMPLFKELHSVEQHLVQTYLGYSLDQIMLERSRRDQQALGSISKDDALFMDKPNRIHYLDLDLSIQTETEFFTKLSPNEIEDFRSSFNL